jgi:hypothetical protein
MNIPQLSKPNKLNQEIERVISKLEKIEPHEENYEKIVRNLQVLYEAKATNAKAKVSPDVLLAVVANIGGILLILNYEKLGIITTKAMGLLAKNKI